MSGRAKNNDQYILLYRNDMQEVRYGIQVAIHSFTRYQMHTHDFYEFEYVLEGEAECRIDETVYQLKAHDLVFVTPSNLHTYNAGGAAVKLIHLQFDSAFINPVFDLSEVKAGVFPEQQLLERLFYDLYEEWNRRDQYFEAALHNAVEKILTYFLRETALTGKESVSESMHAARRYIRQHFREDITLQSMCKKYGYSPSYFSRRFKAETGMGFVEYLTEVRLEYADRLLRTYGLSVNDACYESGFGDVRSFRRSYTAKYGMPPSHRKTKNDR